MKSTTSDGKAWLAIGKIEGLVVTVVHWVRRGERRIISVNLRAEGNGESVRDASKHEQIVTGTGAAGRVDRARVRVLTDDDIDRMIEEDGIDVDWSSVEVMDPEPAKAISSDCRLRCSAGTRDGLA